MRRITNPEEIRAILDAYVFDIKNQSIPFIPGIFSREFWPGGVIYEAHRPMGISSSDKGRFYSLSNGDSNYRASTVCLELSKIEYVELLP